MNEYEILLSYLDKQKKPEKKKPELLKPKSFEDIQIEQLRTKKLIDNSQENISIKIETPKNKSVGFDVDKFENLMRSHLIDDYKKLQSYERPYISVTELFYCCRKSYYSRMKYQTDLKKQFNFAYLDLINRVGNTVHEYVQEIYNFTEVEKTIISEKYKVKGRIDAMYENFLYEFKTLDEKKFKGIYLVEHYYQPLIYAYILNSEYNYNIKTITLVYFFRDNLKRKPYTVDLPTDDKIAISFLEKATLIQNSILKKEVPEPYNCNEEQCRWCPYITFCEKDSSMISKSFENKKKQEKVIDIDFEPEKKKPVFLL